MDSEDGHDLKLKKLGQVFQVLMVRLQKITKQIIMVRAPRRHFFDMFFITLKRVFMYFLPPPFGTTFLSHHIVMILVQKHSNFLKLIFFRRNLFSSDLGTVNAKNSSDTFMTKWQMPRLKFVRPSQFKRQNHLLLRRARKTLHTEECATRGDALWLEDGGTL